MSETSGSFRSLAQTAGEPVRVEEGHEEQEVVVAAVVRRGREQQEIAGLVPDELAELEPQRALDLVAVEAGGHLVGLVDDDEVPVGDRRAWPGDLRCERAGRGGR